MCSAAPFNGSLSALRPGCISIATQHSYSSPSQRHKHSPVVPGPPVPNRVALSRIRWTLYLVVVQCTRRRCCWQDTAQRVPVKFVNHQSTKARRAGIAVVRRRRNGCQTHRDVRTPDHRKLEPMAETPYTGKEAIIGATHRTKNFR